MSSERLLLLGLLAQNARIQELERQCNEQQQLMSQEQQLMRQLQDSQLDLIKVMNGQQAQITQLRQELNLREESRKL